MSDLDPTDIVSSAFAGYRTEVRHEIIPPGGAAVRATVKHQRKRRSVTIGVLVVALLAAPAAGYAAFGRGPHSRPQPGASTQSPPAQSPSPGASSSRTAAPPTAPDGQITPAELGDATITVPPWAMAGQACPSGRLTFSHGVYPKGSDPTSLYVLKIVKVVHANLDGDSAVETAVLLSCRPAEAFVYQVLAFDRDSAGKIVNLGLVVQSVPGAANILDIVPAQQQVGPPNGVRVNIGTRAPCCGTPPQLIQTQWRVYGWDGHGIGQVGGPTAFPPNPYVTDLAITVGDLVFGPVQNGTRHGELTVTVRDKGPFASDHQTINVSFPAAAKQAAGWTGCYPPNVLGDTKEAECIRNSTVKPGQSYTIRFALTVADGAPLTTSYQPSVNVWNSSDAGQGFDDLAAKDNTTHYTVRLSS